MFGLNLLLIYVDEIISFSLFWRAAIQIRSSYSRENLEKI